MLILTIIERKKEEEEEPKALNAAEELQKE
jgi:hypothetical protein